MASEFLGFDVLTSILSYGPANIHIKDLPIFQLFQDTFAASVARVLLLIHLDVYCFIHTRAEVSDRTSGRSRYVQDASFTIGRADLGDRSFPQPRYECRNSQGSWQGLRLLF